MERPTTLLPHERVIYYGDTAHVPYGDVLPVTSSSFAKNHRVFSAQALSSSSRHAIHRRSSFASVGRRNRPAFAEDD